MNTGGDHPDRHSVQPQPTSLSLLEGIRANDQQAWERFVRLYAPVVQRWCRRAGLPEDEMPDVVQELFRTVATKMADFRREGPGDSFHGWLWTITQNKIRDHFRRQRGQPQAGGGDAQRFLEQLEAPQESSAAPDVSPAADLFRRGLEMIQGEFEPRTWQAFWRVVVEEHAGADVAADLGLTVNAVYKAKARVLQRLRRELGDFLP